MNIVSHETKKQIYGMLLKKWQERINLISKATLDDWERRHWDDSIQLMPIIASLDPKIIIDLGSGGGFPALPLKITNPDFDIHCIESDGRKCSFLQTVSRETQSPVTVHNMRLEDFSPPLHAPILITARGFAPIVTILELTKDWHPDVTYLLLKGESYAAEIADAQAKFQFQCELYDSKTHLKSKIIAISSCVFG